MTIPLKFGPFLALKMMTDSAPVLPIFAQSVFGIGNRISKQV